MPRRARGITAALVAKGKPGRYGDGGGLYLTIRGPDAKFWSFRYVRAGRMREIGLGPAAGRTAVSLADARRLARDLYDMHRAGRDPLAERTMGIAAAAADASKAVTFEQAAADYIEAHRTGWRNAVHAKQWEDTLRTYAYPIIGALQVSSIETTHIVDVLKPIWNSKPETASRVRGRVESILGREKALGHCAGENPARWRHNLDAILPKRSKVSKVKHHAAMPAAEIGDFMAELREDSNVIARALEFCIITCGRTNETIGAKWSEIDLNERLWIIPAERMKGDREHRVPLSSRAIAILRDMQRVHPDSEYVFPTARLKGGPLSPLMLMVQLRRMGVREATVHGFRSSFRDWVSESTNFSGEVAEMALAHAVSDKVEAAYRRGDLLAKRFALAEKWAQFCARPSGKGGGKVVSIGGAR